MWGWEGRWLCWLTNPAALHQRGTHTAQPNQVLTANPTHKKTDSQPKPPLTCQALQDLQAAAPAGLPGGAVGARAGGPLALRRLRLGQHPQHLGVLGPRRRQLRQLLLRGRKLAQPEVRHCSALQRLGVAAVRRQLLLKRLQLLLQLGAQLIPQLAAPLLHHRRVRPPRWREVAAAAGGNEHNAQQHGRHRQARLHGSERSDRSGVTGGGDRRLCGMAPRQPSRQHGNTEAQPGTPPSPPPLRWPHILPSPGRCSEHQSHAPPASHPPTHLAGPKLRPLVLLGRPAVVLRQQRLGQRLRVGVDVLLPLLLGRRQDAAARRRRALRLLLPLLGLRLAGRGAAGHLASTTLAAPAAGMLAQ